MPGRETNQNAGSSHSRICRLGFYGLGGNDRSKRIGREIPRDLSIVGFDDNPSGLYGPVALTTIRQPLIKMAQESVKELNLLMSQKEKPKSPKKILLPTELVIRESCQPPSH